MTSSVATKEDAHRPTSSTAKASIYNDDIVDLLMVTPPPPSFNRQLGQRTTRATPTPTNLTPSGVVSSISPIPPPGFDTERFACITRKYSEGLSGFITTPDGELLAYFRIIGYDKSCEGSLKKLLPCNLPRANDIFRAGADGLLVANDNLRVRFTNAGDVAAGRLTPEYINTMHRDPTKIQTLKDACNHSKVSSQAKRIQKLNPSAGKVTITCDRPFDQASSNGQGEYCRTFSSFKDCRTIITEKAADKLFHIKSWHKRRESIANELAEKRLAGTSMEFPAATSDKGGWFPAFRITPHP